MEKRQHQSYYLPFAGARFKKYSDLAKEILEPTGQYQQPVPERTSLLALLAKISAAGENYFGAAGVFDASALSRNWSFIINYLKEKKIITDFYFEPLFYDEPKVLRSAIISPFNVALFPTDGRTPRHDGYTHGDSLELEEAISKCVGEFLERFPLIIYKERDLFKASMDDFKKRGEIYFDIEKLAGFSEEQKKAREHFRFNTKNDFLWAKGKSLFSNKNVFIPAQLIFWTYNCVHRNWGEPILRETNTNGAGGHYTLSQAILAGIYELVQRDGFFIYWLNCQPPPKISLKTLNEGPLKELLKECLRLNFEIEFLDTTTELGIPSCICVFLDHSGIGPKISLGAGCGQDWDKILLRSLVEASGVYHSTRQSVEWEGGEYFSLPKNYLPFQDASIKQSPRLSLWGNEKMFENFKFFLRGKEESLSELKSKAIKFSSVESELKYLIEVFKKQGEEYEIFYYQAKHKILDDLGYVSVKVIIPAIVPLYLNEIYAPLGASRLKEVPERLGFKVINNFNPLPHPFP